MLASLFVLLAVGCGYPYSTFETEYAQAACAKFDECNMIDFFGGSIEDCEAQWSVLTGTVEDETGEDCPNYDRNAASDCIEDWDAITCAQLEEGQYPAACELVCTAGTGT